MKVILIVCVGAVLCGAIAQPQRDTDQSLISAIENVDLAQVQSLITNGVDLNAKERVHGWSPLHRSASGGHEKITELLIKAGADVNIANKDGTPLHEAVKNGFVAIVNLLIKNGANVNAVDPVYKNTPLHYIGGINDSDNQYVIADLLVANGADVNFKNANNITPLELATSEKIKQVLNKNGVKN